MFNPLQNYWGTPPPPPPPLPLPLPTPIDNQQKIPPKDDVRNSYVFGKKAISDFFHITSTVACLG